MNASQAANDINTTNNEEAVVTTTHPFEGLANGEERLAKAQLARKINALIKERGLKQEPASELLGVTTASSLFVVFIMIFLRFL